MIPSFPAAPLIDDIVDRALIEDLAGGDLTTDATVAPDRDAHATFVARSDLIVCGLPIARRVFERLDGSVRSTVRLAEGALAHKGTALLEVHGRARTLLAGERVALNLVQRMSGVATITKRYVDAIPSRARTRVVDTRKTTPGLRVLERYAVRCGGGHNHRDMLGSAVLIKDNHLVAAGGVRHAIDRARAHAPHTSRIECEVENLAQLAEALDAGADALLLDNMDDALVAEAVRLVRSRPGGDRIFLEASGGITLERVAALAAAGVDVISVGALTHSAPSADVALDLTV
ncbi:MAG: carboxylating nicotinate-nucleotide diphosphorylase [Deltaproteobacteria bacterium]|nr:carboxylating nicotinate-nucleotide diphosphorylase [Deltaproteobacteria bacterium]